MDIYEKLNSVKFNLPRKKKETFTEGKNQFGRKDHFEPSAFEMSNFVETKKTVSIPIPQKEVKGGAPRRIVKVYSPLS